MSHTSTPCATPTGCIGKHTGQNPSGLERACVSARARTVVKNHAARVDNTGLRQRKRERERERERVTVREGEREREKERKRERGERERERGRENAHSDPTKQGMQLVCNRVGTC